MFCQMFLPAQVKRCAIITYKNGTKEFPQELPNDLSLPAEMKILLMLVKNS